MVTDEKIADILTKNPIETVADRCIEAALAGGGDDNVTVMIVAIN